MAAGRGGAAPPAGPRWTGRPPGSRGWSWLRLPRPAPTERDVRGLQGSLSLPLGGLLPEKKEGLHSLRPLALAPSSQSVCN